MRKDATARRQQIVELAAGGHGPKAIAEQLRLSDRTVRSHLNDPDTASELRRLTDDRLRALARRALAAAVGALAVLLNVAGDAAQPAPPRVAAARAILDSATRLLESADLAERVSALEEQLAAQLGPSGRSRQWGR